jgi:D-serine deaminase-like pyridoxal phosphate-dependent protein
MNSADGDRRSLFYRLDLFEAGVLTGIEFFDAAELAAAKDRAIEAVTSGGTERAEVRDDAEGIVFHFPGMA